MIVLLVVPLAPRTPHTRSALALSPLPFVGGPVSVAISITTAAFSTTTSDSPVGAATPAIAVTRTNPLMITAGDPTLGAPGRRNTSGGGVEVEERPYRRRP